MLNDKENLQRTLFRLEQGKATFRQTGRQVDRQTPDLSMCTVNTCPTYGSVLVKDTFWV